MSAGRRQHGQDRARDGEFERLLTHFGMRAQESGEGTFIRQNLRDGLRHRNRRAARPASTTRRCTGSTRPRSITSTRARRGGLLLLFPDGHIEEPVLGSDYAAGHQPQVVVPKVVWQGSRSDGPWSLTGATMAPGFRHEGFEFPGHRRTGAAISGGRAADPRSAPGRKACDGAKEPRAPKSRE
jgi:hypothetical protein